MQYGIERQIMEFCKIGAEDINDKTIEEIMKELRNYEL